MGKIEDKDIDLHIDRETLLQEYIPKADYETRLKADMVAMLKDQLTELRSMALRVKHNTGSIDTLIDKLDDLLKEVQE